MVNYRIACTLLVLSCTCLAVALAEGGPFYQIMSTLCVLLASQIYASGELEVRAYRR